MENNLKIHQKMFIKKNLNKMLILLLSFVSTILLYCNNTTIMLRPPEISALKQIQFYRYNVDGLKVESLKENTLLDDKLVGYYDGHVDFGIDFDNGFVSRVEPDSTVQIWCNLQIINPNKQFIVNQQYMQMGSFELSEAKELDERANRLIYEKSIADGANIEAQKNLEQKITYVLTQQFKFKNVVIHCSDATSF